MPRHQSTAAKKARAAARQGAKYTAALREEQANSVRHSAGARSHRASVVFDFINRPAIHAAQAALDAVNRPAIHAAQAYKSERATKLPWLPDPDKLGQLLQSIERATAFDIRFTPPS